MRNVVAAEIVATRSTFQDWAGTHGTRISRGSSIKPRSSSPRLTTPLADRIKRQQAAGFAGTMLPAYPSLSLSTLIAALVALSTALLNQATRLNLNNAQIRLARLAQDRVFTKARPSHDGH